VAYWDSSQGGQSPPLLGEIKGTPTIRLYKPKKKQQPGSHKKKTVTDYQFERKAKDMKSFVDKEMPVFLEYVTHGQTDLDKFEEKAQKNGLPRAMLFTSKPNTSPVAKFISTEFRRKMLIAEIKPSKKNKAIMDKYEITDFPALIVIHPDSEENEGKDAVFIRYEGTESKDYSKHRLITFLEKHALKEIVMPKKKETAAGGEDEAEKPDSAKTEF